MKTYKLKLLLFSVLFFLYSCGGGTGGTPVIPPPVQGNLIQKYFFIAEFNSDAIQTYVGITINNEGEINYFILDRSPPAPPNGLITEEYLDSVYNQNNLFIRNIDEDTFTEKKALIMEANNGQLTGPIQICFDAGTILYSAFLFNTVTGVYERVIVYSAGSLQYVNNNPAAVDLRNWLIDIAIENQVAFAGSNCNGDFTGVGGP